MAEREISVFMESRYKSDLSSRLRQDKKKIDAFQKHLDRRPLKLGIQLDMRGAMVQVQALRKSILGEFAKMPASILGADGRPATAPATSGKQMNKRAGVLSVVQNERWDKGQKAWVTDSIDQLEQLARGVSQISKSKPLADGTFEPLSRITKDISNVQDLRDALRGMNKELGESYGRSRGKGDKAGQIAALAEHRSRLNAALQEASKKGLNNSPDYIRAETQISRIGDKIAGLEGGQDSAAAKKARSDKTREIANQITEEERRVQQALKANKLDMDASERIKDKAAREAEVNRLYDQRKKLFEQSRNKFGDMDKTLQGEGRNDLADRAMRRGLGMDSQATQATLDKQRAETDRLREDDKERARLDKEAAARAEKAKRLAAAAAKSSNLRNFSRTLRLDDSATKLELSENDADRNTAASIQNRARRELELNELLKDREAIYNRSATRMGIMESNANMAGDPVMAAKAEAAKLKAEEAAAKLGAERAKLAANSKITTDKEAAARAEKAKRIADKAATNSGKRGFSRAMRMDDYNTNLQLAQNKADQAAAQAIPDRAARETELNRVLSERSRIYQEQADRMKSLRDAQARSGNMDNAAKAEAAQIAANKSAAGVGVQQSKAAADAQLAAAAKLAADQKKADTQARAARESDFTREMQDIKSRSDSRIAQINATERSQRAAARSAEEKANASRKAHKARTGEYNDLFSEYAGLEGRARSAGHATTADAARGKSLAAKTSAARDVQKFGSSAQRSGHALNFHSSALLRNAAAFVSWMVPAQAVMGMASAFAAGFDGAVKVDRQFATLRSVFRGTAEEVQRLKRETLDLAVAQGRSSEEAMDAAIRWSRLGLNRAQVNLAVKTSLMAANVAEITAAESAEKLSAIYATYRLNVGDLPVVLSRLNAISNRYNVTNKDLLEGIVRVAGVAKATGMELRDLEGIIGAVTGATGRPGQEVGNALKFVITRLGSPEAMAGLKKGFDIDLTNPNGDLKDMSQIFRELADIYPTLNNAQKQYFLKLTAGSRQAARFALILDQYRQGQILAAEAGFDTASAFQENQKILESLQSRIDSLKASWVDLFNTMGDAGVFEFIKQGLRGIEAGIEAVSNAGDKLNTGKPVPNQITINNPTDAATVENLGGGFDVPVLTRSKFDEPEVLRTILAINQAIKDREKLIAENADTVGNMPMSERIWLEMDRAGKEEKISDQGLTARNPNTSWKFENYGSLAEAKKNMAEFMALQAGGGDTGATDALTAMTHEVDALRERLGSLQRAVNVFDSLGAAIGNGSADRETMVRDFEAGAHLLLNLEDGANKYGDAIKRFYAMLDSGDKAGIQKLTEELGTLFSGNLDVSRGSYENSVKPVLDQLRAKRLELERQRRDLLASPQGNTDDEKRTRQSSIEQLQGDIKAAQGAIEQLTQSVEIFNQAAYGPKQVAGISQFLDDLLAQSAAFAEAYKDFAPDAANDPVDRIYQRQRKSLQLGRDYLRQTQAQTNKESAAVRAQEQPQVDRLQAEINLPGTPADRLALLKKELEERKKIIAQQNEADAMALTALSKEEVRIANLERELDIKEQIAKLQRVETAAGRVAADSSLAWRFGETDSDKDANQAAAAIARANKGLAMAGGRWLLGEDDPSARSAASGQVLQDEATARTALETMQKRGYELEAARKQVAFETVTAMKQQTEEASKRLLLASREDQLRAAALARTIRDKGPIQDREFFALSQETRQAAQNFLPKQGPDILNEAKTQAAKSYQEIDRERGRLKSTIGNISGTLDELARKITAATRKGGALDTLPRAPDGTIQGAAGKATRDQSPIVNVNIGDVAVSVKIGEEIKAFMTDVVSRQVSAGMNALRQEFSVKKEPNAQAALGL